MIIAKHESFSSIKLGGELSDLYIDPSSSKFYTLMSEEKELLKISGQESEDSMFNDIQFEFEILSMELLGFKPDPFYGHAHEFAPKNAHIYIKYRMKAYTEGDGSGQPLVFNKTGEIYYIGKSLLFCLNSFVVLFISCFKDKQSPTNIIEFAVDCLMDNAKVTYNPTPSIMVSMVQEKKEASQGSDVIPLSLLAIEGFSFYPNIHSPFYEKTDVFGQGLMPVQGASHDVLVCETVDKHKMSRIDRDIPYVRLTDIADHNHEMHYHFDLEPNNNIKLELFEVDGKPF